MKSAALLFNLKEISLRKYSSFSPTKIKGKKVSCVMEVEASNKSKTTEATIACNDVWDLDYPNSLIKK